MKNPRFVDVMGARTRYFEAGAGTNVVLIHGGDFDYRGLPSAESWGETFFELLADRFHTYAFDKLGSGMTDNPQRDDRYTMTAVIEHASAFIAGLDLDEFVLVGHSRGALPAARIATELPSKVRALVLFDTNTLAPDDGSVPAGFYTQFYESPSAVPRVEEVRRLYDMNVYVKTQNPFRDLPELLPTHRDRPFTREAIDRMYRLHLASFLPDLAKVKEETIRTLGQEGLKPPCLVIWGRNDPSAPVAIGIKLFEILANSSKEVELHVINQCGHDVPRERPNESASILSEFVTRAAG